VREGYIPRAHNIPNSIALDAMVPTGLDPIPARGSGRGRGESDQGEEYGTQGERRGSIH